MTTQPRTPKLPTFYRTVTITTVKATLDKLTAEIEIGGDITMGQAIKRLKESDSYKATFKDDQTPEISVTPRKEEREITIDAFLANSTVRVKPEPKAEQVVAETK